MAKTATRSKTMNGAAKKAESCFRNYKSICFVMGKIATNIEFKSWYNTHLSCSNIDRKKPVNMSMYLSFFVCVYVRESQFHVSMIFEYDFIVYRTTNAVLTSKIGLFSNGLWHGVRFAVHLIEFKHANAFIWLYFVFDLVINWSVPRHCERNCMRSMNVALVTRFTFVVHCFFFILLWLIQ